MEAINGAGLAVATSAKENLRAQPMLGNVATDRSYNSIAGHPPMSGIAPNDYGRGVPPERAAAVFLSAPCCQARALHAKDDLRQQSMLMSADVRSGIIRSTGLLPRAGVEGPTFGRGLLPQDAAAGFFRLLPVVAPRELMHAPEWNDRVARYMAA